MPEREGADLLRRIATALNEGGGQEVAPPAPSRGFGAGSLKVNGRIFAMCVKGALVLKLPHESVKALVDSGDGTPFDPGHGRIMKEWVVVPLSSKRAIALAREARDFVGARPPSARSP